MAENWIGIGAKFNGKQAIDGIAKLQKSFITLRRIAMTVVGGKIIKDISAFGREMNMMAERTGMSITKLSSLRNAFISAGSGAKGFESVINNIASGLQGLMMGRGDFAAKLGMIGVSPYTAGGSLKSESQVLYDIADWAKSQRGRMSKQQLLYQLNTLFGIDTQLGEKLLGGGAAFKKLQEEADKRMGTIDKETTKSLDNIKTKWDELYGAVGNTTDKVVASLEKPLAMILDWSREVVKFAGDKAVINDTTTGLITLGVGIETLAGAIGGVITGVGALAGGLMGLGVALAAVLAGIGGSWLGSWFAPDVSDSEIGKRNLFLEKYKTNGKMDYKRLQKDFDEGKLSQNQEEAITALSVLSYYDPKKYGVLWNASAKEKYGYTDRPLPEGVEQAIPDTPMEVAEDNRSYIIVQGDVTEGTLNEIMEKGYDLVVMDNETNANVQSATKFAH